MSSSFEESNGKPPVWLSLLRSVWVTHFLRIEKKHIIIRSAISYGAASVNKKKVFVPISFQLVMLLQNRTRSRSSTYLEVGYGMISLTSGESK